MTEINLYFMRHSLSCVNYEKSNKITPDLKKNLHRDTPLTKCGKKFLERNKYKMFLPKFDIILSSPLMRAIQTSYEFIKKNNKISLIPHISKVSDGKDGRKNKPSNNPLPKEEQIKFMKLYDPKFKEDKIDYSYLNKNNPINFSEIDKDKCLKWIKRNLNSLCKKNKVRSNKKSINIFIGCHSKTLKILLNLEDDDKVLNNDIVHVYMKDGKEIFTKKINIKVKDDVKKCKIKSKEEDEYCGLTYYAHNQE